MFADRWSMHVLGAVNTFRFKLGRHALKEFARNSSHNLIEALVSRRTRSVGLEKEPRQLPQLSRPMIEFVTP